MTQADDLGRIVIPKEIRRTMHIREGDPLEIYTDNSEGVVFRKYSPVGGLSDISESIADSINRACGVRPRPYRCRGGCRQKGIRISADIRFAFLGDSIGKELFRFGGTNREYRGG